MENRLEIKSFDTGKKVEIVSEMQEHSLSLSTDLSFLNCSHVANMVEFKDYYRTVMIKLVSDLTLSNVFTKELANMAGSQDAGQLATYAIDEFIKHCGDDRFNQHYDFFHLHDENMNFLRYEMIPLTKIGSLFFSFYLSYMKEYKQKFLEKEGEDV